MAPAVVAVAGKKTVLVVGGGYAGLSVCKALQNEKLVQIILLDAREGFLLNKFSSLRAVAFGEQWLDRTLIPSNELANIKFVQGRLLKVDAEANKVLLHSGEEIAYDAIVICTGARNFSPAEPPLSITTLKDTRAYFTKMGNAIQRAKRICIYGAGLVGIELAGEILSKHGNKKAVFLIKPKNHSLAGGISLTPAQGANLERFIKQANRNLFYVPDEDLSFPAVPNGDWTEQEPIVSLGADNNTVRLASGKRIDNVDLVIFCLGGRFDPATITMFPNSWLHVLTGELKIAPTFRIESARNAFALGDIAKTGHAKLGSLHMEDGPIVAENVKLILRGEEPKPSERVRMDESKPSPSQEQQHSHSSGLPHIAISFGKTQGRLFWARGGTSGNLVTRVFKSSHLYTGMIRQKFKR